MGEPYPPVQVAVAVIIHDGKILAEHNPRWASFTLPMTKLRQWNDPETSGPPRQEDPRVAAARAASEVLGRSLTADELPEEPAREPVRFQQGDRTGEWRRYEFHVYKITLSGNVRLAEGVIAEWLTRLELLDKGREPISKTARLLLRELGPIGPASAPSSQSK